MRRWPDKRMAGHTRLIGEDAIGRPEGSRHLRGSGTGVRARGAGLAMVVFLMTSVSLMVPAAMAATVVCGGSGSNLAAITRLGELFMNDHPGVEIKVLPSLGSGGAIKAAAAGRIDLGLASRGFRGEERYLGVELKMYARTPLVLGTAEGTPDRNVTLDQFRRVLAGENLRWADGTLMLPVLRPRTDSDTIALLGAFPELTDALEAAYGRKGVPINGVEQNHMKILEDLPGSIGTVALGAILAEKRGIKPLSLDGITARSGGRINEDYPVFKPLFFVVRPSPDPLVRDFMDFVWSERGGAFLNETGHLSVAPHAGTL